MHLQLYTTEPR